MNMPAVKWYLDGLIPDHLTSLAAFTGTGRTIFALNMVEAIGNGGELLGYRASQKAPVYYACFERGEPYLYRTIEKVWRNTWPSHLEGCAIKYHDPCSDELQERYAWVESLLGLPIPPQVIILDHLAELFTIGTRSCSEFLQKLARLAVTKHIGIIISKNTIEILKTYQQRLSRR